MTILYSEGSTLQLEMVPIKYDAIVTGGGWKIIPQTSTAPVGRETVLIMGGGGDWPWQSGSKQKLQPCLKHRDGEQLRIQWRLHVT